MEILDSAEVMKYTWGFSWSGFIFAIIAVTFLIIFIIMAIDYYDDGLLLILFLVSVLSLISIFIFSSAKEELDYIKYSAIIEDNTPISEVLDKYEILDIHGKLYELKEKTED